MSGLVRVGQDDFGAGMLRGVAPDVQPGVGVFNATNAMFNDDGDVLRRGGTTYYTADPVSTPVQPLAFIWTGYLFNVARILVANSTGFYGKSGPNLVPPLVSLGGTGFADPVLPAIVNNAVYLPNLAKWTGAGVMSTWVPPASLPAGTRHLCAAAGRLLVAAGNRVAFSVPNEPENFVPDDYHDLPGGVLVIGMTAIRDTAFVFTNYGLYTISNLAFDLTDAAGNIQQQLQLITPELSLWGESGLSSWAGNIIAPCNDRIYMLDGLNPPMPLSDSISSLYMEYVRSGFYPGGGKVYRNTYFLPIIKPITRSVEAMLTCRLNRPVRARQTYYPWSMFTGHGANFVMADFALLSDNVPRMLGAHKDGHVVDLSGFFSPSDVRSDADGTTYPFDVETRDFPTGTGQPNHVRQVRLRYTGGGDGGVLAGISIGTQAQRYEDLLPRTYAEVEAEFTDYAEVYRGHVPASGLPPSDGDPERYWYSLGSQDIDPPGVEPLTWRLNNSKRARFARMRFRTEDPMSLVIHHVDMSVRRAGHDR